MYVWTQQDFTLDRSQFPKSAQVAENYRSKFRCSRQSQEGINTNGRLAVSALNGFILDKQVPKENIRWIIQHNCEVSQRNISEVQAIKA